MSLLEEAKKYKPEFKSGIEASDEEIELMLALLKGEIEPFQARRVSKGLDTRFRLVLQEAYRRGILEIKDHKRTNT